ncbi:hypothetical protein H0H81_009260 [Sphagnurus paluster]|uniref:MYND-type domain-containing protein n=1 Tax=Sphagnurus paluster TaxID=117069 RepID=A0A9P7GQP5_9AGAR|nr:hypothetical protein H0H81_009260 [Sphagnurus paluster]
MHRGASAGSTRGNNDGGLEVPQEMMDILKKPGFISIPQGGQRLRHLYVDNSMKFQPTRLSDFGLCCFIGHLEEVQKQVDSGTAPDLEGTEMPYKFGYATLVVSGAQRIVPQAATNHAGVLKYLISRGLPVDVPDIVGYTALSHALTSDSVQLELGRLLITAGKADVNHRNRYGEVTVLAACMKNHIPAIELLLEHGADIDIKDADGTSARESALTFGPQVTAIVQKWVNRRSGKEPPRLEKKCDECGKDDVALKNCAKCQVARYCSVECQRKAWPTHKKTCKPFSSKNTATLKPFYVPGQSIVPTEVLQNSMMGMPNTTPSTHYRSAHVPKGLSQASKNLIIKVQVPVGSGNGPLLVYSKKRDFVCTILREDAPAAYDRVAGGVRKQGVGGAKAYFAAELKSKDELVVKVAEVLAEQPF